MNLPMAMTTHPLTTPGTGGRRASVQRATKETSIAAAIKQVLTEQGLKMPQLAMPVRVLVAGTAHTPSVDALLELMGKEKVIARLKNR